MIILRELRLILDDIINKNRCVNYIIKYDLSEEIDYEEVDDKIEIKIKGNQRKIIVRYYGDLIKILRAIKNGNKNI